MKIAAVVILYNPDASTVSNIESYYNSVEKIFVFDNTEGEPAIKERLKSFDRIEYFHSYENRGIAERLNEACERAIEEEFEWILTMDQDSAFSADAISRYFDCFRRYPNKESVALFGANYRREIKTASYNCEVKEADDLITSGALLNLSLFKKIGQFDENLFIDHVDREYSVRSKLAGYSLLQFTNIYFTHEIGTLVYKSSIKSLFLFKKRKEIHSPLRCYYIYRNMLYLEKKYLQSDKTFTKELRLFVVNYIKRSVLYGGNATKYFKYLKKAKLDFKNNKMGKITEVF